MTQKRRGLAFYVAALAIQRGTLVAMVPVVGAVVGIEGLGFYTFSMALAYLGASMLGLGSVSSIMREAAEDFARSTSLFYGYTALSLLLSIAACASLLVVLASGQALLGCSIVALALLESVHQKIFAFLRIEDRRRTYLTASVLRLSLSLASVPAAAAMGLGVVSTVSAILLLQTLGYGVLALAMGRSAGLHRALGARLRGAFGNGFAATLAYTLPMVPHNAALWAIGAAGRLFVFRIDGAAAAGYFGGISSIASIVALANVSVANLLPQPLYRDYDAFVGENRVRRLFTAVAGGFLALYLGLVAASALDRATLAVMPVYVPDYPLILALLVLGFLWMVPYSFYAAVLVHGRRTGIVSAVTLACLAVALPLFHALVTSRGALGAALATALVQALHAGGMGLAAGRREPMLRRHLAGHLALLAGTSAAILGAALAVQRLW